MIIRDGDTNRAADVNADGELAVALGSSTVVLTAVVADAFAAAAVLSRAAFYVSSYLASVGDAVFYFLNSTAEDAHLERLILSCAAPTIFQIVAVSGTAAGTDITPTPGKVGGSITPTATVKGNAAVTGLTPGTDILTVQVGANEPISLDLVPLIAQNNDIAVYANIDARVSVNLKVWWD
jgi:hypothetical protein